MEQYTEVFKALSDETRLRIVRLLIAAGKELCCCEITDSLGESQYNISRHLKVLKNAALIKDRKEGRWVYSNIANKGDPFKKILFEAVSCLPKMEKLKEDERNLRKRLRLREGGKCVFGIGKGHLVRKRKE
ncbi:MAG: ArsR/SmtB family transcription factor [bacterium]